MILLHCLIIVCIPWHNRKMPIHLLGITAAASHGIMKLTSVGKLFLQIWGMWPIEAIQTESRRNLYKAYRILVFGWYSLFLMSQTTEFVSLIIRKVSFERLSKCISVLFTTVLLFWKGIVYLKNEIPQMCLKVEQAEDALSKLTDKKVQKTYQKVLASNTFVNICYVVSLLLTLVGFIGASLVDVMTVGPDFCGSNNVSFMHELYLPFDQKKYCYAIMIANIGMAVDSVILSVAIQTTFFGLTMYASLRFRILGSSLESTHEAFHSTNKDITTVFKEFLEEHQDSIRFVEQLNEAIKNVLLVSFLLNSAKVACVLCQMMSIADHAVLFFPIFLLTMILSEVFFLGWLCNEVKEQSLSIADAAYNTSWYNLNKDVKVMMQIMIIRAQKPSKMSIGPFGEMTTDTIVKTLKAGYSYATLVMNQKS